MADEIKNKSDEKGQEPSILSISAVAEASAGLQEGDEPELMNVDTELEKSSVDLGEMEVVEGSDIMDSGSGTVMDTRPKEGDTIRVEDVDDEMVRWFTDENSHMNMSYPEWTELDENSSLLQSESIASQPDNIYISDESNSQLEAPTVKTIDNTDMGQAGGSEKTIEDIQKPSSSVTETALDNSEVLDSSLNATQQHIAEVDKTTRHTTTPFVSISELSVQQSKGDQKDFRRWPPNVEVPVSQLTSLLTCAICNGYFVNATTVTECMHTFCRSCIVRHINTSLHCPRCLNLIHPSNPFLNLRPDATLQGILYKVLPHLETEEIDRQMNFYSSRGLPFPRRQAPPKKAVAKSSATGHRKQPQPQPQNVRHVPVQLLNAGSSPGLPKYPSLKKRFLWLPDHTTIGHIKTYVCSKLKPEHGTQVYMFIQAYLVHDSLRLQHLQEVFGLRNLQTKMIKVQYAVLPLRNYLKHGFCSLFPPPPEEEKLAEPLPRDTGTSVGGSDMQAASTSYDTESMLYSMLSTT